jgi:hypothetical protein
MDNAFIQILIREIENLNLRYSQYSLLLIKGAYEKFPDDKIPEEMILLSQNLIDEIKISILQIFLRLKAVSQKIRLTAKELETFDILQDKILRTKVPLEKELKELIETVNQIYAENIAESNIESTTQTVREFTRK